MKRSLILITAVIFFVCSSSLSGLAEVPCDQSYSKSKLREYNSSAHNYLNQIAMANMARSVDGDGYTTDLEKLHAYGFSVNKDLLITEFRLYESDEGSQEFYVEARHRACGVVSYAYDSGNGKGVTLAGDR